MTGSHPLSIHLEFTSTFEMVDFVEVVGGHVSRDIGLDEDAIHWVGVAIRECVINAIKHGNQHDVSKRVFVEFATAMNLVPEMTIRVRDQGQGFDPEAVADPLAPENLLKGSGRGIFLIRNFMDEVDLQRAPQGGMEVRMVKRAAADASGARRPPDLMSHNPLFLTTAIEAVVHAGDMMMARVGSVVRIDKKSAIDLVTEVDVAIERMFRDLVGRRFPDHAVLGEELGGSSVVPDGPCWVFDPIDGTTNFAHGLPIFCSSLALEIDGVAEIGAVYDPSRRELFTAERGGGAFLNGRPIRVSAASTLIDAMLVTGFPYDVHTRLDEIVGLFRAFVGRARAVRRLGSAALDLCYVAAGRMDGFWERDLNAWDIAGGALLVSEAGGRVTTLAGDPFSSRGRSVLATNDLIHNAMLDVIRTVE